MLRRSKNGGNWWERYDWCGPYISDGKFQSSYPGYTTARSAQEQLCKEHDIAYYHCKSRKCFEEADRKFRDDSWALGVFGKAAGTAVYHLGSYFHGDYEEEKSSGKRPREETPDQDQKRLRGPTNISGQKRPASRELVSLSNIRRTLNFGERKPEELQISEPNVSEVQVIMSEAAANGTTGEIGLKPFGHTSNIQPDYFTSDFKWIWTGTANTTNLALTEFRLNSPYDPAATNILASDTTGNAAVNGWALYKDRYKYYRVIKTRAHIHINFPQFEFKFGSVPTIEPDATVFYVNQVRDKCLYNWPRASGISLNPGRMFPYTNAKVSSWTQLANARMSNWKITQGQASCDFYVDYDPFKWTAPVAEQQREQFWTPISENPPIQDHYVLWMQPCQKTTQHGSSTPAFWAHITITHTYTVQFREWSTDIIERSLLHDSHAVDDTPLSTQAFTRTTDVVAA